jgi:RNA-splicing ligase RtcB
MIELKGKYNKDCKIFIDNIENEAIGLIQSILDQPVSNNVPIRIMPDTHAGKGIVIGFTMPLTSLLSPGFVGVDIGCGMLSAKFSDKSKLNLEKIDNKIRENLPMGFNIHESNKFNSIPFDDVQRVADIFTIKFNEKFETNYKSPTYNENWLMNKLRDIGMDINIFYKSIGTLGGGNHFIEIGKSDTHDSYWVTIHSGSRNFGLKIADYWTNVAKGKVTVASDQYNKELEDIILNTEPKKLIPIKIKELKDKYKMGVSKDYLSGDNLIGYLYDMIFAQHYAMWNRQTMLDIIKESIGVKNFEEVISTIHNYIDFNDFIIRKGAISSYEGQKLIIPFNMRDGLLICEGKSNKDWNYSAPHGAGRIMSRSESKQKIDLSKFKKSMMGVYSTSVSKDTLDESPFAYKNSELIEKLIQPTVTILEKVKPILNIKDSGKSMSWKEKKLEKKKRDLEREFFRKMKKMD